LDEAHNVSKTVEAISAAIFVYAKEIDSKFCISVTAARIVHQGLDLLIPSNASATTASNNDNNNSSYLNTSPMRSENNNTNQAPQQMEEDEKYW
jgi:hypothetical protein